MRLVGKRPVLLLPQRGILADCGMDWKKDEFVAITHDPAFNINAAKCCDDAQDHVMDRCSDVDLPSYPALRLNSVLMLLRYSRPGRNPRPGVQEFCGFFAFPPQEKRFSSVAKRSSLHLRKAKADTSSHQKRVAEDTV